MNPLTGVVHEVLQMRGEMFQVPNGCGLGRSLPLLRGHLVEHRRSDHVSHDARPLQRQPNDPTSVAPTPDTAVSSGDGRRERPPKNGAAVIRGMGSKRSVAKVRRFSTYRH